MCVTRINDLIVQIDEKLARQLQEIINNDDFQQLRASWTGLHYLSQQIDKSHPVKIKILSVSWNVLVKDLNRHANIEHSYLFDKVNNNEFAMPGGEPFALLIGDYQLDINPVSNRYSIRDIQALKMIAQIAAASFTLFITSTNASAFGFDNYRQFSGQKKLHSDDIAIHQQTWKAFRQSEQSRFIGLVIPKILLNSHYEKFVTLQRNYYNDEILIWANAIYAYAAIFIRSFIQTGWFLDALGIPNNKMPSQAGLLPQLTAEKFNNENDYLPSRLLTEIIINESLHQALSNEGFTVLSQLPQTAHACFINSPSLKYSSENNRQLDGEQLACLLPYLLCVCRFAHHIKVIGRNKLGQYQNVKDCEYELQRWLSQYIASNNDISTEMKARFPLNSGEVNVISPRGHDEYYICVMRLSPQLRTNQTSAQIVLQTAITPLV